MKFVKKNSEKNYQRNLKYKRNSLAISNSDLVK